MRRIANGLRFSVSCYEVNPSTASTSGLNCHLVVRNFCQLRQRRQFCSVTQNPQKMPDPAHDFSHVQASSSKCALSSVCELDERIPDEVIPTHTEIAKWLSSQGIDFDTSKYQRYAVADCVECGAALTTMISTQDGTATCIACHTSQPFLNYKKRVTIRKTETTSEDEVKREEERKIEETLRRMDDPSEFDSDIHDEISYLNLMDQFNEKKLAKRKERPIRARDEIIPFRPRGLATGGSSEGAANRQNRKNVNRRPLNSNYDDFLLQAPPHARFDPDIDVEATSSNAFLPSIRERSVKWIDMDDFLILPEPEQVPYESDVESEPELAFDSFEEDTIPYDDVSPNISARSGYSSDAPSPRAGASAVEGDSGVMASAPSAVDPHIKFLWNDSVDIGDLVGVEQNDMLQLRIMLGVERISTDTLSRYNVRGHMDGYDQPAILYPRYRGLASRSRVPAGLKVIRKIGDKMEKENYPLQDESLLKPRFTGIFGYHMMTASDRAVVLTSNERDALAVYEATNGALAFALPSERLDSTVFPYLEDFDTIFLWFPDRHLEFAKEWGCALNGSRCFLIKSAERPIELVRSSRNKEVKIMISQRAVRVRDRGFRSMTDIREEVKADLMNASSRQLGLAQWKRFAPLNRYLIGFRPGELTVLTGGTGFGKTTFLCEYALDLFTQGVRTLFCSFEMPEEKILKWMLVQFAGPSHLRSLARTLTYRNGIKIPLYRVEFSNQIDNWLDKFERTKGPLTIMKSDEFMDKSINEISMAIRTHVTNNGCQHVVIDNLQFLVNQSTMQDDKISSFDRFHQQDRFVGQMRKLASELQVHITMVVHPRKTETDTELDIQHFGGSARVTQEADNVLAIQRRRDDKDRGKFRKYLYILKNRYGGRKVESDTLEMVFQSGTYSHALVDHTARI